MTEEYILETSKDGKIWEHKAAFQKCDPSRFGLPFDANVAVEEADNFYRYYQNRRYNKPNWKYVRIVINLIPFKNH